MVTLFKPGKIINPKVKSLATTVIDFQCPRHVRILSASKIINILYIIFLAWNNCR